MRQDDITYETPSQPRQVRLDTIAQCNATCLSCHRFLSKRKGEMSSELLLTLLRDIARWETHLEEIVPVNYGEFFMRKDWAWILEMISHRLPDTIIVIPTNGYLLGDKAVEILSKIKTLKILNFSINAFFEETYMHFMGLPAANLKNIETQIKKIKLLRPDILAVASMVFDPVYQTDWERDEFFYYWKEFPKDSKQKLVLPQVIAAASAGRQTKEPLIPRTIPCRSLFSDIVIGLDGKLSSCCWDSNFDAFDLGYYSGDLKKDWKNPQFQNFREIHNSHRRQEILKCKKCTFA